MKQRDVEWSRQLARLQNEKGTLCISIILPADQLFPAKRMDDYILQRRFSEVKDLLGREGKLAETAFLVQQLERLAKEVSYVHGVEGIGLFVSKNIHQWLPLYFPVKEKISIAQHFDTRELLYQDFFAIPYHVLLLSKKKARLFTGIFNQLTEVTDSHFPLDFNDDYEYSRPTRGLTYEGHAVTKDFEREKTQLKKLRQEKFMQQVDDLLKTYMAAPEPLLVAGTEGELSSFVHTTTFTNLVGHLHGGYFYLPVPMLGDATWQKLNVFLQKEIQQYTRDFEEKSGTNKGVNGITSCWQSAYEGNVACLLVEKDYACAAYLQEGHPDHLQLVPPQDSYRILPDAVSALIALVKEKGGDVVLVENGALLHAQQIGLVTRY